LLCPWGCQWPQKLCLLLSAGCWGPSLIPAWHLRTNETLICPYNGVCCICIWKCKSGWFLFAVSLGLLVVTEFVLAAVADGSITDFQPKFCSKSTLYDTTEWITYFLAHTMVFVGSIWKNKSGWFLFVMTLGLSVATEIVLAAGVHHWFSFSAQVLKSTLHNTTEPMKLLFVHAMVFDGSVDMCEIGWPLWKIPFIFYVYLHAFK
jgi:uncharacterized membrane protein AbrB (regulator of aidB expression)